MERTIHVTNGIPRNFPKELRRKFIEESKGLAHDEREALLLRYVQENDRRLSKKTVSEARRKGVPDWVPPERVRAYLCNHAEIARRPKDW